MLKTFLLSLVAIVILALPAEAGLRDKLGGLRGGRGGGDDECADGSCGRPIGMGLKKPGSEVGTVTGDGLFVKMYEAQPEQPEGPVLVPQQPADRGGVHPLVYLLACSPLALLIPLTAGAGAYFAVRKAQEGDDD